MAVTKHDFDAVARQDYPLVEQASFEVFLDRWGHTYQTISDALADWRAMNDIEADIPISDEEN